MRKILVKVKNNSLHFSEWLKKTDSKELNNTNVINIDSIKLSEDYINNNLELVSQFIKLLCIKEEITKAVIDNYQTTDLALKIIDKMNIIKELVFSEDIELNYSISSMLLYDKTLEKIECYSMPDIIFKQFPSNKIETREEILFFSNFMEKNNINTMSKLKNKDKIELSSKLSEEELDEMKFFFSENKNLEKMIINDYDRKGLVEILDVLKDNHLNRILIIINETPKTTKHILGDIEFFQKLNEIYFVNIKIKYSKEYTAKYRPIEYGIKTLRYAILAIAILSLVLLYNYKVHHKGEGIEVDNDINEITDIIDDLEYYDNTGIINDEEVIEYEYVDEVQPDGTVKKVKKVVRTNPYYQKYGQAYDELLSMNSDTIGWIKVNNTKINYPVVQAKDNEYYLDHSFYKKYNSLGWIFADYRNTFNILSDNTIIYGHNAINLGLMFGTLDKVLNKSWYTNNNNLTIIFSIKNEVHYWKIFSVYTTKTTNDYLITDFDDREEYQEFLNMLKGRSQIDLETTVKSTDKILTLSTCHNDNNHRLVVHAVKIS